MPTEIPRPDPPTVALTVGPEEAGRRLDAVLGAIEEIGSRAEAQRLIDDGRVLVDGAVRPKRHVLAVGERVRASPRAPAMSELVPEEVPFVVMYEDEDVLVVDKPAGVVTHPSRGHGAGTLVHGLLAHRVAGGGDPERPGIVHRLDRDTSGLLVVARNERAHRRLGRMMRRREIARTYLTLVHGPTPPAMEIDRPIGRDPRRRTRMAAVAEGRPAVTRMRRLEEIGQFALLEVTLETGRTHQIRVHLEAVGMPVVGDPVYGRRSPDLGLARQFLHAARLSFPHPEHGGRIEVESPLPDELEKALAAARAAPVGARARRRRGPGG